MPEQYYDPDELEKARNKMKAEKDVLDKEEDLFTGDTEPLEHQKGGEALDPCAGCGRLEDYLNDDDLCDECEMEAGIDRKESERDAYEGGVGSGRKPEGTKSALLPEQTARAHPRFTEPIDHPSP